MISAKSFWYIVAESHELKVDQLKACTILNEWIVLFRDSQGRACALEDRCLHRTVQLSKGRLVNGRLQCSYHGWVYNGEGQVTAIPSEGPEVIIKKKCARKYDVIERDDYIYIKLDSESSLPSEPFSMPCYKKKGYTTIRLQNTFENNVTNCAENFVDIPHTTFVHPKIFRDPGVDGGEPLEALVTRQKGHVKVSYFGEKKNFGLFSWFLNPKGLDIVHTDEFFMPNITTVNYWFTESKHFIITSQSIPQSDNKTLVYTDLTYNYGIWTKLSRFIVKNQGQKIIDQDIVILKDQMKCIEKFGTQFSYSPCDIIHTYIETIQKEIQEGRDPEQLTDKSTRIKFWI
jgi:phenylpropionate dioxygenase-like ring-hydroxylating dioxygenase large terminal subunit